MVQATAGEPGLKLQVGRGLSFLLPLRPINLEADSTGTEVADLVIADILEECVTLVFREERVC
jgi:hypothetical protein